MDMKFMNLGFLVVLENRELFKNWLNTFNIKVNESKVTV